MKKIYCEKCFCEVETKEYDVGIYVIPCDCNDLKIEEDLYNAREDGYDDGWSEGYEEGYENGNEDDH